MYKFVYRIKIYKYSDFIELFCISKNPYNGWKRNVLLIFLAFEIHVSLQEYSSSPYIHLCICFTLEWNQSTQARDAYKPRALVVKFVNKAMPCG